MYALWGRVKTCELCGKECISAAELNDHIKSTHCDFVMWIEICDFCGKLYTSFAEMNEHFKCSHSVGKSSHLPLN